jgi:hypothetical protein
LMLSSSASLAWFISNAQTLRQAQANVPTIQCLSK